jgi:D-serine deaminase-like pyridoxal phosphate-dependent protein
MSNPRERIGASKEDLDTPCLVIDQDLLEKNIRTMQDYLTSFGKKLRPHAKTHKCSIIARKQMEAGGVGICVAKVSEAEVLAKAGLRGVLITSPVVTDQKIIRLMECLFRDPDLMVVVDNPMNARMPVDREPAGSPSPGNPVLCRTRPAYREFRGAQGILGGVDEAGGRGLPPVSGP